MAVRCVFCKEPIDLPIRNKLMDVRMYMFKKIMKKHYFNKQQLLRCPLCDDCDKTLQNYYNCKADIASCNEDFLNYMDSNNKVDLYKALVSMERLKRFENESVAVKVCRICFKATQDANYREVKSWEGPLARMIALCLPEFDIDLTDHTYFCPECYSSLLQYNQFLSLCLEVTKTKKRQSDNADPLELTSDDLKEKRQKMCSNVVEAKVTAEPLSMSTLLIPVAPKKRGPGRPRKGEELDKQDPEQKLPNKKFKKRGRPRKGEELNKKDPKQKLPKTKLSEFSQYIELEKNNEKTSEKTVLKYECQVCTRVLTDLQALNEHLGKHGKETKFLCRNCGFFCSDFKDLKAHFVGHQKGIYRIIRDSQEDSHIAKNVQVLKDNILNQREKTRKTSFAEDTVLDETEHYECQICPGVFDNIEILRDHINGHKLSRNFKCWKCCKKTITFESFRQHLITHGFTNIYKTIFVGNNCPLNKQMSKDVGKDQGSSSKSIITGVPCSTCKETLNNLEEYLDHSCPSSSKSTSDISCTACTLKFDTLDNYMDHSCNTKKQQFSCGHCSNVFDSLDDLDEHNCNVAKNSVVVENKSKTIEVPSLPILFNTLLQGGKSPTMPAPMKTSDPDYECSYCLNTFTTVTALDMHSCTGEPENDTVATESRNIPEIKNETPCTEPANDRTEDIILLSDTRAVKKEDLFECGFCLSLFETENELNGHMCSEKAVEAGSNTNEDIGNEIKTEEIDLAATQKKALVNKIASLFGVKIVEGSKKKTQKTLKKLKCDGCGLQCQDENDLMFHFKYYCPRVRKCDLCSYKTYVIQKLVIHSLQAHNLEIFSCLHCRFTTYMEENFKKHIPVHDNAEKNKTLEKTNLKPTPTPNIILNYTDAVKNMAIHNNVEENTTSEKTNLVPIVPNPTPNIILNYTNAVKMNMATLDDPLAPNSSNYLTKSGKNNFVIEMPEENNELIIPDIVERDPLQTFNEDSNSSTLTANTLHNDLDPLADIEELQTDNVTNVYFNSSTLPDCGDTNHENSNLSTLPSNTLYNILDPLGYKEPQTNNLINNDHLNSLTVPDSNTTHEPEKADQNLGKQLYDTEATILIDDDSDSEFVESAESRISDATTQLEGIYPVTAIEASKLISEGVPVVREASLLVKPSSDNIQIISNVLSVTKDNDNTPNSLSFISGATSLNNNDNNLLQNPPEAACNTSNKENKSVKQYGNKRKSNEAKTAPSATLDVAVEDKAGDSDGSSFFITDSEDSNPASSKGDVVAAEDSFVISDDEEKDSAKPLESNQPEKEDSLTNKNVEKMKEVVTASSSKVVEKTCDTPENNVILSNGRTVRSRGGSTSSVELSRDFSNEVEKEGDSEDDCIFVSEDNDLGQSKNIISGSGGTQKSKGKRKKRSSSNDNNPEKIERPPNAMQIFIAKAKSEMQKKYPSLTWSNQKNIIMNAWRGLSDKQKWPFREEARLHKLLFRREHPEFDKRNKRIQPVIAIQPQEVTVEDIQEITLD